MLERLIILLQHLFNIQISKKKNKKKKIPIKTTTKYVQNKIKIKNNKKFVQQKHSILETRSSINTKQYIRVHEYKRWLSHSFTDSV